MSYDIILNVGLSKIPLRYPLLSLRGKNKMKIQLNRQINEGFTSLNFSIKNGKMFLVCDWDKVRVYPPVKILKVLKAKKIIKIWFADQVHLITYIRDYWDHKEGFKVKLLSEMTDDEYYDLFR